MKIKTKEQYNKFIADKKPRGGPKTLPLGRKNKTKSGLKKEAITS